MTTLQIHNDAIKSQNYTGVTTRFSGYIQFEEVRDDAHALIAFTAESVKKAVEAITSPLYLYSRQKKGYISIYGRDDKSPTGVSLIGGIPNELEFLLYAFGKTGQVSTTEDIRTAH